MSGVEILPGIVEFLLTRIAEDEQRLRRWEDTEGGRVHWPADCDYPGDEPGTCTCNFHAQLLADWDAKRRIVEWAREREFVDPESTSTTGAEAVYITHAGYPRALELLALPYSDHPDYRDEWRP